VACVRLSSDQMSRSVAKENDHSTTSQPAQGPKLLDRLRTALLIRGTKPEAAEAQLGWVRSFIHFYRLRHPETMGEKEIGAFLTHLGVERCVSLAQQAQARLALRFLYRGFLHRELGPIPVSYVPAGTGPAARRPRPLLEQMRDVLRTRHYAPASEDAYLNW